MKRSIKIVLIVSLVLNVLIIAAVGGMLVRFWWQGSWPMMGASPSGVNPHVIEHIIEELPEQKQVEFIQRFEDLLVQNARHRQRIRRDREALRDVFRQPNFDQAEYQRLSQSIRQAKDATEVRFTKLLGDALVWMPADERRELNRWLNRKWKPKR